MKERKEEPIKNGGEERIGEEKKHVNLYLHEYFKPIPFFDPMDYNPWSEEKFWLLLKATKKEPNLRNRRGHSHQNWLACISHQPLLA